MGMFLSMLIRGYCSLYVFSICVENRSFGPPASFYDGLADSTLWISEPGSVCMVAPDVEAL